MQRLHVVRLSETIRVNSHVQDILHKSSELFSFDSVQVIKTCSDFGARYGMRLIFRDATEFATYRQTLKVV